MEDAEPHSDYRKRESQLNKTKSTFIIPFCKRHGRRRSKALYNSMFCSSVFFKSFWNPIRNGTPAAGLMKKLISIENQKMINKKVHFINKNIKEFCDILFVPSVLLGFVQCLLQFYLDFCPLFNHLVKFRSNHSNLRSLKRLESNPISNRVPNTL